MTPVSPTAAAETKPDLAAFAALLAVAAAGNGFISLSPIFVGAMMDYWGMSARAVGTLVSYEFLGASIATILAIFSLPRPSWPLRRTAFSALLILVLGNVATPFIHEQQALLAGVRITCGLAAGTAWIVSATALALLKNNKRVLPIFYGLPFFIGMVFQPVMPSMLESWGPMGAYFLLAVGCVLCLPVYGRYLERRPAEAAATQEVVRSRPRLAPVVLVLASFAVQFAGNTGLWTYFERIGVQGGHSAQATANTLSVALAFTIAGALIASAVAERWRPHYAIAAGSILISLASGLVLAAESWVLFLIAASLFCMMITFIEPFYFIMLEQDYDPAKGAILGNIATIAGFTAGPVMIGYTIVDGSYQYAAIATIALFTLSVALVTASAALRAPPDAQAPARFNAT